VPRVITKSNVALPDSRLVANSLPADPVHSGLNGWFTFFGQFISHDLAHTPSGPYNSCACGTEDPECFNIKISEKVEEQIIDCLNEGGGIDCAIDEAEQACIPFARSADVKHAFECNFKNREQFTKGTHFLDIDALYGSTLKGQRLLRAYKNGELKYDVSF